jgi:hypothetical protein
MNRRRFTLSALVALGISRLQSDAPLASFHDEVQKLLVHTDDAIAIGRRYLVQRPDKASHRALLNDVTMGRWSRDDTPFLENLREWRTRDFREGHVVVLDGWVLARSEVSLCAWLALG